MTKFSRDLVSIGLDYIWYIIKYSYHIYIYHLLQWALLPCYLILLFAEALWTGFDCHHFPDKVTDLENLSSLSKVTELINGRDDIWNSVPQTQNASAVNCHAGMSDLAT